MKIIKKAIKIFLDIPVTCFVNFAFLINKRNAIDYVIKKIMQIYSKRGDEYLSIYYRPKTRDKFVSIETSNDYNEQTAIVMQGPLMREDNFTLETVKFYNKIYSGAKIIVSTWKDEDKEEIKKFKGLPNCYIVQSEKPQYAGPLNQNYQVVSTLAGIKKAKELGVAYVIKSRTDNRFTKNKLIQILINLVNRFSVEGISYQQKRIILMSNTYGDFYNAYFTSDQFAFGMIDDMIEYWSCDMFKYNILAQEASKIFRKKKYSWKKYSETNIVPEVNLIRNYIKRKEGVLPEVTIKKYWEILKKQFIILDKNELGAYWHKYNWCDETAITGIYHHDDTEKKLRSYNWNFFYWLLLYSGDLEYKEEYERFQLKPWVE